MEERKCWDHCFWKFVQKRFCSILTLMVLLGGGLYLYLKYGPPDMGMLGMKSAPSAGATAASRHPRDVSVDNLNLPVGDHIYSLWNYLTMLEDRTSAPPLERPFNYSSGIGGTTNENSTTAVETSTIMTNF